jgi:hypothetical protein
LQCCGCERIFLCHEFWFEPWDEVEYDEITGQPSRMVYGVKSEYWPAPVKRKVPAWVEKIKEADPVLGDLLLETYAALNSDLNVLAGIGARSAFDRAVEQLKIDPAITFEEKLDALVAEGKVGADERDALGVLVEAGSAAAHRGWKPTDEQLSTMMNVVEVFLHRSFVLGDGLADLRASMPPKPTRRKPRTKKKNSMPPTTA